MVSAISDVLADSARSYTSFFNPYPRGDELLDRNAAVTDDTFLFVDKRLPTECEKGKIVVGEPHGLPRRQCRISNQYESRKVGDKCLQDLISPVAHHRHLCAVMWQDGS
ncbi:MAG: hypothetical protein ETSY2_22895 [Candidatus Entotheonella gemina]|uniref:Uncharacterized protein n=1 Tax=Candidatus Entotheonella gemina TaxID=1429439 RepID=W4M6A7_9BACT|nr:MAG: hypothetical protein ETSY2_22895 [Candidatus Entotheonella gemina]